MTRYTGIISKQSLQKKMRLIWLHFPEVKDNYPGTGGLTVRPVDLSARIVEEGYSE
jgi:hypothetical protein